MRTIHEEKITIVTHDDVDSNCHTCGKALPKKNIILRYVSCEKCKCEFYILQSTSEVSTTFNERNRGNSRGFICKECLFLDRRMLPSKYSHYYKYYPDFFTYKEYAERVAVQEL